jgi:hypothetical protein
MGKNIRFNKKLMKIDVFKKPWLFEFLERFNEDILNICSRHKIIEKVSEVYNPRKGGCSWWFHPGRIRDLPLTSTYPDVAPLLQDKKFNLILYAPNYLSLFLIELLYRNRLDVMIEDYACGMGRLVYFLSKCGFKNFNCIDSFLQLAKCLLEDALRIAQVEERINRFDIEPTITNIIGYPHFNRGIITTNELYIFYTNNHLCEWLEPQLKSDGYAFLCEDSDEMAKAYCRNDKYEEFKKKIKPYATT